MMTFHYITHSEAFSFYLGGLGMETGLCVRNNLQPFAMRSLWQYITVVSPARVVTFGCLTRACNVVSCGRGGTTFQHMFHITCQKSLTVTTQYPCVVFRRCHAFAWQAEHFGRVYICSSYVTGTAL